MFSWLGGGGADPSPTFSNVAAAQPSNAPAPMPGGRLGAMIPAAAPATQGQGSAFPFQIGGASAEMCNALVAAAGDPACSDVQRRRRVLHCIDLGVPVDYEDPDGVTPLLAASVSGHIETIKVLLEHRADVDFEPKRQGGTALIVSCAARQLQVVELLCQVGAVVDYQTAQGRTAFLVAVSKDHLDVADALLNYGANPNFENRHGQTPLLVAVEKGLPVMMQLLLERNATVDHENAHGDTALLAATRTNQVGVMSVLLDGGADVNHETQAGLTPIIQASLSGRMEAARLLVSRGANVDLESSKQEQHHTPLLQVAIAERLDAVDILCSVGADPNKEMTNKSTALCEVAALGLSKAAAALIKAGADVNQQTSQGHTALMRAAAGGHVDTVNVLLHHNAIPSLESLLGRTALSEAASAGQLSTISQLLTAGANPRHTNFFHRAPLPLHRYFYTATTSDSPAANALQHQMGATPLAGGNAGTQQQAEDQLQLHRAIWGFISLANGAMHGQTSNPLFQALADLGERCADQVVLPPSPLHAAVEARDVGVVRALLQKGADPNTVDRNGATPLHYAVHAAHKPVIAELVANGANVSVRDKEGKQPIDYAMNNPELAMVMQLIGSDPNSSPAQFITNVPTHKLSDLTL